MRLKKILLCIAVSISVSLNLNGQNNLSVTTFADSLQRADSLQLADSLQRVNTPQPPDTLELFRGDTLLFIREDSLMLFRVDTLLAYNFPAADTVFVKLNTLLAIGVVNPAVEIFFNHNNSLQLECMGVFYRKKFSVTGKPLMMGNAFLEYRHYFEKLKGLYLGADVGYGVWKLNRDEVPGFK